MKRVTASKQHKELNDLKVLAAILNFDWDGGDAGQLEKLINAIHPVYFLWVVGAALKDRKRAKSVQEELKADLLPILSPEGKVDPEKAYSRIKKFLRKLNEIESKAEWEIEPVDYEGEPMFDMHPTAKLNLLGYRWYIGRTFGQARVLGFSREALYQSVLDAFESGTIERLRTCRQCKAFFVAEDNRQQFCSDEHRNEFNNKQRLSSGWFKDHRSRKRKRDLARARKLLREGKSPGEIAKATKLSQRVLKREGIIH